MASKVKTDENGAILNDLSIHIVTWNVNKRDPPKDVRGLVYLGSKDHPQADIYVIGLQEVIVSPVSLVNDAGYADIWTQKFTDVMAPAGYVRLATERTLGILQMVFVKRRDLLQYTELETVVTRTGLGNVVGNKGGVSIRADVNGTSVIFVNSHLAAHDHKVIDRVEDYIRIVEEQKFKDESVDNILDHDYVFWYGDLNFRLDELPMQEIRQRIAKRDWEGLAQYDQLRKAKADQLAFVGFKEGPLDFPPTYKFDVGTDVYDSSEKQRRPAWTDRVLTTCNSDAYHDVTLSVRLLQYCHLPDFLSSDHRPVVARYSIKTLSGGGDDVVRFNAVGRMAAGRELEVTYTARSGLSLSAWDWVALYKADFRAVKDYLTYFWAAALVTTEAGQTVYRLTLDAAYLGVPPGAYVLGYYSQEAKQLIGLSQQFQVFVEGGRTFRADDSSSESSSSSRMSSSSGSSNGEEDEDLAWPHTLGLTSTAHPQHHHSEEEATREEENEGQRKRSLLSGGSVAESAAGGGFGNVGDGFFNPGFGNSMFGGRVSRKKGDEVEGEQVGR